MLRTVGLVFLALLIGFIDWLVPLGLGESVFEILQALVIISAVWSAGGD